jgi:hypothetical protein
MKDIKDFDKYWLDEAKKLLLHKRIVNVRYLTQEEADEMGWYERSVAFQTHDGLWFFPSRDDEGNGGGALFTSDNKESNACFVFSHCEAMSHGSDGGGLGVPCCGRG